MFKKISLARRCRRLIMYKKVGAITLNGVSLFVQSFLILSPGGGLWRRLRRRLEELRRLKCHQATAAAARGLSFCSTYCMCVPIQNSKVSENRT